MQRLWRGGTGAGPVFSKTRRLERRASRPLPPVLLSALPMPSALHLHLYPSPSPSLRQTSAPAPVPRVLACSYARSPCSSAWLCPAEARGFCAVEGIRNGEKGGSSDVAEDELRKEEQVAEGERRSKAPRPEAESVVENEIG